MSGTSTETEGEVTDILGMSDEDFLNLNGPPSSDEGGGDDDSTGGSTGGDAGDNTDGASATVTEPEASTETAGSEAGAGDPETGNTEGEDGTTTTEEGDEPSGSATQSEAGAKTDDKPGTEPATTEPGQEKPGTTETVVADPSPEVAVGFFKKIMAPFKANGKMIQVKKPEEAIQLMQMGANYTRKMQDIQPHRKALLMLETNGLLDEGKLSYLIDLDQKNPEAIKKLIKEAGIDPLDLDMSVEPEYLGGTHAVSDDTVNFHAALQDLVSTDEGKETLQTINGKWDQASKEALGKSPEMLSIIHSHRESGVYALITDEMDRQITLGTIKPGTPFLEAYHAVGQQLEAEATGSASSQAPAGTTPAAVVPPVQEPAVVATRVAAPKATVANGDKASAAATTPSTPRKVNKIVNPLAMSDEEFLRLPSHLS